MNNLSFLLTALILAAARLTAQQATTTSGEPIDFMTIVVEGKATLHLPKSLLKESPRLPLPYRRTELDSINPLEKVPLFRSEPAEYPRFILPTTEKTSAIIASAGLYGFASLHAMHLNQLSQYTLNLEGIVDRGGAYLPNADYLRTRFHAVARTAASDPAQIYPTVGNIDLSLETRSYKLFAVPAAPIRSARLVSLSSSHQDQYNESPYHLNVVITNAHLRHADTVTADETELHAQLRGGFAGFNRIPLTFDADASIRNYRGHALHFHTLSARGRYADSTFAFQAQLGTQVATTSLQTIEFSPVVDLRAEWQANSLLRLTANLGSQMEPVRFSELLVACPYIADTAVIRVNHIAYRLGFGGTLTPTPQIRAQIELQTLSYSEGLLMVSLADGTFAPQYATQLVHTLRMRGWFTVDNASYITADIYITDAQLTNGGRVPYRPLFQTSVEYGRTISDRLIASARLGYVSARRTSIVVNEQLASYVVLAGSVEYGLSYTIAVRATFDNLISSTIELWRGYRERGSFVAIGAVVRF